jgi:CubicO group peptidase (beta-lactamase class C family)
MKKNSLLVLCFFLSLTLSGQIKESEAIDSIFMDWNNASVPGCALGVIKGNELVYSRGYGSADLEHDLKITPSSVFYIGSVSKQFVTFSILLLEEQGKLDLDDRIQKFLPDFPEYESPLTIRHFIHHTSGVRDYLTLMYLKGRNYLDDMNPEEVYELIRRQKELNFSPGEKYLYSNSCYFMLAMIVEKASGQTLKNFAQQHIFEPLGMKSTIFYDDNTDLIKNRVFSYRPTEDEGDFDNLIMRFDLVGSGGVYSNIEDLFLWDQNFYQNKLGKGGQAIIEKMHIEGLLNSGESSGYAFALNNGNYKGLKTVSHGGSLAGYRAQLMRFPDQHFSVIILANRGDANPTAMSYQVADILLEHEFMITPEEKETEKLVNVADGSPEYSLTQLTGTYELQPGASLELSIQNDSLHVFQTWNKAAYNIVPVEGNTYEIPGEPEVRFVFSDFKNDHTQVLTVIQNGKETTCKRKNEIKQDDIDLDAYTGVYYSEEIDARYRFFIQDDKLNVQIANNDPMELDVYGIDQFVSGRTLVQFKRSEGILNGFDLDAGRVKNLKFEKI